MSAKEVLFKTKHTKIVKEPNGHEMIQRPIASAVLCFIKNSPYVKGRDKQVIMVMQERGSFGKILEVPAGKVDKGEDSIDAGIRELKEETGYQGDAIELIGSYFPSVGYSTEQIDCFLVKNGIMEFEQRLDDGERINITSNTIKQLEEMIDKGEIKDSKTIMCLYFYKRKYPNG